MHRITVLPGDGIGPEIIAPAVMVLKRTAVLFGFELEIREALIGGAAMDATGLPLPQETLAQCLASDGVLLGAVGGPKWDGGNVRPEQGLLQIRKGLGLFANLRPATVYDALRDASPLKAKILAEGLDILVVRELTGGIYFGERGRSTENGQIRAWDVEQYTQEEIRRIARKAFDLARLRKGRLCSVDKANVLESSRLWREEVSAMAAECPDVSLTHMYVDNAAMQLVRSPSQFDVILTSNMFGDILSDEASQITGSIGMLPSASLGAGHLGLYEPIHGSAPDIAGKDLANPIATILSAAMLLRHSCGYPQAASAIEGAVELVLAEGFRTADIASAGTQAIGTQEMGARIAEKISGTGRE